MKISMNKFNCLEYITLIAQEIQTCMISGNNGTGNIK
jgi:predicted ATP-binding protein involved in virulence